MKIVIVIAFFLGCICIGLSNVKNYKLKKISILCTILSITVLYVLGILAVTDKNCIVPAIEVYRGNTELQITYQDSTPIDSVVVYKNKNK